MKWNVTVCVDLQNGEDEGRTTTDICDMLSRYPGIAEAWFNTTESIGCYCKYMNFTVVAEEMPVAKNLLDELKQCFDVAQIDVTRECWHRKTDARFQWTCRGVTAYTGREHHEDSWRFLVEGRCVCTVHYVPSYTREWGKDKRERTFGSALYCYWRTPAEGTLPLEARNIEDALNEFEQILEDEIRGGVEEMEKKLSDMKTQLEDLTTWRSGKE